MAYSEMDTPYLRQAYANKVEGIVGNEDVGQMSAWYILAASGGIHPVCPGETRLEITSRYSIESNLNLILNILKEINSV